LGQVFAGDGDLAAEVLQPARYSHCPATIAKVPTDLAEDGRDGESGEGAAPRVEPVHRVEQSDRAHLDEIVVWLTASAEPLGKVVYQGKL
jgi:hypothetical protein